mmetsp:Transcript_9192/g.19292  ORF Transcript_9192/g.19292 Transcript_9192/m.19292 type:complete len:294 (-) Transcript_9192:87-968(-)
MKQYVFGYGSLICAESRAITLKHLGDTEIDKSGVIPIRLRNWIRLWNVRGPNTYLGVQCLKTKESSATSENHPSCIGVLVPLPSSGENADDDECGEALKALDRREIAYERQSVDLELIERVDDLLVASIGKDFNETNMQSIEDKYYKNTFLGRHPIGDGDDDAGDYDTNRGNKYQKIHVWIYVPIDRVTGMARALNPILQSYVDIALRGCLSYSESFGREFVKGTYGWYPGHSHPDMNNEHEEGEEEFGDLSYSCWLNDREDPIYVRADKEYSLKNFEVLDATFDPVVLKRRA